MARKKVKRKQHPNTKVKAEPMRWDHDGLLRLLAYLNWCIQTEVDFKATVEDHIRAVTGKSYSFVQIDRKLRSRWQGHGQSDLFEDVYTLGTAAFLPGQGSDDERIVEMIAELGSPPVARYCLRGGSSRLGARSRTLSTAAPSRRGTPASTPRRASRHFRTSHLQEGQQTPNQRANITAPPQATTTSIDKIPSRRPAQERTNLVVKGEGSETCTTSSLSSCDLESTDSLSLEIVEDTVTQLRITRALLVDETTNHESTKRDNLKHIAYAFTLRYRLLETQTELKDMRNCTQRRSRSQSAVDRELCNLRGKLREKSRLLQASTPPGTQRVGAPTGDVRNRYNELFLHMYDLCADLGGMDVDEPPTQSPDHSHGAAQHWARKVSGWTLENFIIYSKAEAIPREAALTSLVGAAIFTLVFEPVFPEVLALELPILHKYRRLILTKDGRHALSELDHRALEWLTSQDDFATEVIPEKANSLAAFIADALQFLLPRDVDGPGRLSPDHSANLLAELGDLLGEALKLKVKIDHSMSRMKFVYTKPGDSFDADTMKQGTTRTQTSLDSHQYGHQRVKICMLPALYMLPPGNYGEDMDSATDSFSASRNTQFTEAGVDDLEAYTLLAKAIVLV